jgi:YfiH family protein
MDSLLSHSSGLSFLQNPELLALSMVQHGTTTRQGGFSQDEYYGLNLGLSTGDDTHHVEQNRQHLFNVLKLSATRKIFARQVHGNHVAIIDDIMAGVVFSDTGVTAIPETDALVTRCRNTALFILTADCLPVFIVDVRTPAIGLVHAGWKGSLLNIAAETVQTMTQAFGTNPEHCSAWLSVAIGPCCYEVSEEMLEMFQSKYPQMTDFHQGSRLDLSAINRYQLFQAGMIPEHIHQTQYCAKHDAGLFYSHRRDASKSGRIASFLCLP